MKRISSMPYTSSVESLEPPSPPEKKWPTRSAGPHYPVVPLVQPLLRVVLGEPRFAVSPIEWIAQPAEAPVQVHAILGDNLDDAATVTLPSTDMYPIPDHWFDFLISDPTTHIGFTITSNGVFCKAVFLLSEFSARKGVLCRPLLDNSNVPIATLTLDFQYATVHPLGKNGPKIPFVPRFTGHRGMGSSGPKAPWRVPENSIESFAMATLTDTPVETVELDVQVTRDNQAIIYHDWFYRPRGAGGNPIYDTSTVKIPIHDLTFDQLDMLYRQNNASNTIPTRDASDRRGCFREWATEHHDFPNEAFDVRLRTLRQTCELLPPEVGMLVELKYPPPNIHNGRIPYPERNNYVDLVLSELLTVAQNKSRSIAFLTFDADICMLLSLKQTKFPVYLSHCEVLDKPCDEFDPRTIDIREGFKFVESQNLDGMMLFNKLVEKKPREIEEIVSKRLPIITYGARNCDEAFVKKQFQMGVQGIIADDIDALMERFSTRSV